MSTLAALIGAAVVPATSQPTCAGAPACHITVLTLGLFLLVINVIIVKLADYLMSSFDVHGILNALLFSLALSVVNAVVDMIID